MTAPPHTAHETVLSSAQLLLHLQQHLGATRCIPGTADAADLQPYCEDWRDRETGTPLCVVLPQSTEEVVHIVQLVRQCPGASIVPQGGNTGLVLGGIPDQTGAQVLLSLRKMNRVRSVDVLSLIHI